MGNTNIPFSFWMDYIVDARNNRLYCVDINATYGRVVVWDGGYFELTSANKLQAWVKRYRSLLERIQCPRELYEATKKKSDQLPFIPEENRPKSIVVSKRDFLEHLSRGTIESVQFFQNIVESTLAQDILVAKRDNTFWGLWVSLLSTEDFLKSPEELYKKLWVDSLWKLIKVLDTFFPLGIFVLYTLLIKYLEIYSLSKWTLLGFIHNVVWWGMVWYTVSTAYTLLKISRWEENFVFQQYIPPKKAENAPLWTTACMRHLVEWHYDTVSKEIQISLEMFSQRVWAQVHTNSLFSQRDWIIGYGHGWARPVAASEDEKVQAKALTEIILKNIFWAIYKTP